MRDVRSGARAHSVLCAASKSVSKLAQFVRTGPTLAFFVRVEYVVQHARDGQEALELLGKHNLANHVHVARDRADALTYLHDIAQPKVVLLDLKLPKVNGLEVLEKIREDPRLCDLPVVVLTFSREEPDIARAYQLGVNSYIVKPVDFEQFVSAISQVGLYWLLINQGPRG
ncbi:MAG TPA: response regulator [Vicinamibacterales bacterium]